MAWSKRKRRRDRGRGRRRDLADGFTARENSGATFVFLSPDHVARENCGGDSFGRSGQDAK
jgi:hypothetical protein